MTSFCTRHSSRPIKRPLESEVSRVRRDKNPLARAAVGCYTLKFKHFCSFLLRVSPSTRYQWMCSGRVWLKPFLAPRRHFVRFYRKRFQKPHEKVWGVSLKGVWWLHVLVIYLGWSTAFTEWEYLCNLGGFFFFVFFCQTLRSLPGSMIHKLKPGSDFRCWAALNVMSTRFTEGS